MILIGNKKGEYIFIEVQSLLFSSSPRITQHSLFVHYNNAEYVHFLAKKEVTWKQNPNIFLLCHKFRLTFIKIWLPIGLSKKDTKRVFQKIYIPSHSFKIYQKVPNHIDEFRYMSIQMLSWIIFEIAMVSNNTM